MAGTACLTFVVNGGGSTIPTGPAEALSIPFACTINSVTLLADQSTSVEVDIWKSDYAGYPPSSGGSICASAKPTITAAQKSTDSTLTGWTKDIAAGDTLILKVDSVDNATWLTVALAVTKA